MNNKKFYAKDLISKAALALLLSSAFPAFGQQTAPAVSAPPKKPKWVTSASLGFTLTRGNSRTLLFTGNILSSRKWDQSELDLGADATYGKSDGIKNAESVHGFSQYNWLFYKKRAYGYIRLDALHDAIADIQYRITLGPGVGYYFIKSKATQLSGEIGPAFIYEKLGGHEHRYMSLRLGEKLQHSFTEKTRLWQSLELLPQVDRLDNYILNGEIGIETDLTKKLSLRTYLQDSYDNQPAPGRKKNDLKLVTAVAYKF